ncbi:FBD-associated F-box protein At4g10400 [Medicago truncatula]|uniref:F-box/FBD-like domain protein, putative n=2 Tax=Medicago truncatula TaxID=3880 RepID=A0A072TXN9_MEDTR|nr:FBD-associated F-box protein At4g10400 [Medicago truncatula]KEH18300.1 F-box/FBD-like domain protein, putative [Medicago truncatula]
MEHEEEEDRLSNLPKIILHNILSRLPKKDGARTSVLSKAWEETWYTFPILYFSDGLFVGTFPQPWEGFLRKRKNFIDYVKRTLLRFYDNGLAIKQFKLSVNNFELHYMSKDVDHWLKLASECGVELLELCLPDGPDQDEEGRGECYVLPNGVIEVKSLTELVLMGGIRVDTAFMNHSIKFFSLKVLSLWAVLSRDEHAIEHLISCCPLIEHITLKCCSVLIPNVATNFLLESDTSGVMKSLNMHGLLKLKTVDVQGIQEVYIDAPCLEKFCYCPGDFDAPFKIDFDRCQNLKYLDLLSLKSSIITDKWFLELFSKFPFLESLKLNNCRMFERINISSVQLKVLELSNCSNLKEVNIDAPNLLSCVFYGGGGSEPIISFLRSSSQLEVDLQIPIDYLDLCNLRESLQNIKPQNVLSSLSLFIFQPTEDALNPLVFQVSSPPPSIKHLHLRSVPKNEILFSSVVNIILSSCCPATISLSFNPFFCTKAFIEFLYETLMERKEDGCFCGSGDTRCWWHGLKDVKVTSSMKIDENVDFKTMLELLGFGEEISFTLEV